METYKILVCDDDKEIVEAIQVYLEQDGYQVLKAYDGAQALAIQEREQVHLIIMDIMMPHMDGLEATMRLRKDNKVPIILLSAKSEDKDKIRGLNMGADDYIVKPFNLMELRARVKSQLRRYMELGAFPQDERENQFVYHTGGLWIDDERKRVTVDGEEVRLTPIDYKILLFLVQNAGKVFRIDQIYESVWESSAFDADNTVAVHIRRIREKIEINPKEPKYLKVVWGMGYRIEKLD